MKTIEPAKLTNDSFLNKILLLNLGLEDDVDDGRQVIDVLYDAQRHKQISYEELNKILHSRYHVNDHLHEYMDGTLIYLLLNKFVSSHALKELQFIDSKLCLIDRFSYLEELSHDHSKIVSDTAKDALHEIEFFSKSNNKHSEVFKRLDPMMYSVSTNLFKTKLKLTDRKQFGNTKAYIDCTSTGYRFSVVITNPRYGSWPEYDVYKLVKIFDEGRIDNFTLRLRKSNLSLERLIALVSVFFECLDFTRKGLYL